MAAPVRISAEETRMKIQSHQAILVCAYEDEEKFKKAHLEESISLTEFRDKTTSWPEEQEIIFY